MMHAGASATIEDIQIDVDGYSDLPAASVPSLDVKMKLRDMENRISHLKAKYEFLTGVPYVDGEPPAADTLEGAVKRQKEVCTLETTLTDMQKEGLADIIACFNGEKINSVNEDGTFNTSPTTCEDISALSSEYPDLWADLKEQPKNIKETLLNMIKQERELSLKDFEIHEDQIKAFASHVNNITGILSAILTIDMTIGQIMRICQSAIAASGAIPDTYVGGLVGPMGGAITMTKWSPSNTATEVAKVIMEIGKFAAEHSIKILSHSQKIADLNYQLKNMMKMYSIDEYKKSFMSARMVQRLAEVSKMENQHLKQYRELVANSQLLKARCEDHTEGVLWQYQEAHLLISHLEQEKESMIEMSSLLQMDIDNMGLQIKNLVEDLRIKEIERKKLQNENTLLDNELLKTEQLLANAQFEIESLIGLQDHLDRIIETEEQQIKDTIERLREQKTVLIGENRDAKIDAIETMLQDKKSAFAAIGEKVLNTKKALTDTFDSIMSSLGLMDDNYQKIEQNIEENAGTLHQILALNEEVSTSYSDLYQIHDQIDEKLSGVGNDLSDIAGEIENMNSNYQKVRELYAEKGVLLEPISVKLAAIKESIGGIKSNMLIQKDIHRQVDEKLGVIGSTYGKIGGLIPGILEIQKHVGNVYQQISDKLSSIQTANGEVATIQEQIGMIHDQIMEIDQELIQKGEEIVKDMQRQKFQAENGERFEAEDMLDFQVAAFLPTLTHYIEQKKETIAIVNHYLRRYQQRLKMFMGPSVNLSGYITSVAALERTIKQLFMDADEEMFNIHTVHYKILRLDQSHPVVFSMNVNGYVNFDISDIVGSDTTYTLSSDDFALHHHPKLINMAFFSQYNGILKDTGPKDVVLENLGVDHYTRPIGEDLITEYSFYLPKEISSNIYNGDPGETNNPDMQKVKGQIEAYTRLIDADGKALHFLGRSLFSEWKLDYGFNKFTGEKIFPTCVEQDMYGNSVEKRCLIQNLFVVLWYIGDK